MFGNRLLYYLLDSNSVLYLCNCFVLFSNRLFVINVFIEFIINSDLRNESNSSLRSLENILKILEKSFVYVILFKIIFNKRVLLNIDEYKIFSLSVFFNRELWGFYESLIMRLRKNEDVLEEIGLRECS